MIPVNHRALFWVKRYLEEPRPQFRYSKESSFVFVNLKAAKFSQHNLSTLINRYFRKAGLGAKGSCLVFRHTLATTMLENGADIRYIQEMLGHENLSTTQIYTRVSITKLKEVHRKTLPIQ